MASSSALIGSGVSKPALGSLKMGKRFRAAKRGPTARSAKRIPTGSTISYTDSLPATTAFTIQRPAAGIRKGRRCVAPPKHGSRRGKRCTRYVAVGRFSHTDKVGLNKLRFSGRVRGRKLRPGNYRLQAIPSLFGLTGKTLTITFTIVK